MRFPLLIFLLHLTFSLIVEISCFHYLETISYVRHPLDKNSIRKPKVPCGSIERRVFKNDKWVEEDEYKKNFSIHVVSSRERALDVMIFRHGKLISTVEEYMEANPTVKSRDFALHLLTRSFDDQGKDRRYSGVNGNNGNLIQFYAAMKQDVGIDSSPNKNDTIERANGVVGTVDAYKKPCQENENIFPTHIELKNLRVHESVRRQGIGKALIESVQQYAVSCIMSDENKEEIRMDYEVLVYLQFDSENNDAIRLYKETGFVMDDMDQNQFNWSPKLKSKK